MNGTVKKIIADRGFGFISSPELGKDIFFHSNSLKVGTLEEFKEGDAVTFDTEDAPKGKQAINVKRAEESSVADLKKAA